MRTQLRPRKGHSGPQFSALCLLWPNGRLSQQLLSSCSNSLKGIFVVRRRISHPYRLLISDERLSHVVHQPCLTETDRYLSVCLSCLFVCLSVTLVYCGQTVGWIRMPLSVEVGLGPGYIVLDGDPTSPHPQKGHSPQFSAHVCCGQTAGWIKVPLGTEVGLGPGEIVLDGDTAPPKMATHPPLFGLYLLCPNGRPS